MLRAWQEEKCVYWNVSVGSKCVLMSKTWSLLNLSPLNTVVSRKFIYFYDTLAVNLMVVWCLFASKMKRSISSLLVSHKENTSSMYLFHSSGFLLLLLIISVSTADIKMFAKATAIFVPIAVPCVWR